MAACTFFATALTGLEFSYFDAIAASLAFSTVRAWRTEAGVPGWLI